LSNDAEHRDLGGGESEDHDLDDRDHARKQYVERVVDAGLRYLDLLAHGYNGGSKQQDLDPRQLVATDVERVALGSGNASFPMMYRKRI
jgi:hypothetical protein